MAIVRMNNPPPLPPQAANSTRPVQRAVFKESLSFRLAGPDLDYNRIERSQQQAQTWINSQLGIEIIQIQTFHSSLHGITVVWYR